MARTNAVSVRRVSTVQLGQVATAQRATLADWSAVWDADPEALVTQHPDWVAAMVATRRCLDATRLYQFPGGRLVLPLLRPSIVPRQLASWRGYAPGWGRGGYISDFEPNAAELRSVLADLARSAVQVRIRPNPVQNDLWLAAAPARLARVRSTSHVLDLSPGAEALWEGFKGRTRRDVRRSEREGVTVEMRPGRAGLDAYFQLRELAVRRWAERQNEPLRLAQLRTRRRDPVRKFEAMADHLGDRLQTFVGVLDGEPVVARMVLVGTNAQVIRGVMDADKAGPALATDLVEWRAIEACCAAGCRRYHLGDSGENASLAAFKEKFGAEPVRFDELILEPLPFSRADALARRAAKAMLRFKD